MGGREMKKERKGGRMREIKRKAQILHNFPGLLILSISQMKDFTDQEHSEEKIMNVHLCLNQINK